MLFITINYNISKARELIQIYLNKRRFIEENS